MNKKSKMILIVVIVIVLMGIIFLFWSRNVDKTEKENKVQVEEEEKIEEPESEAEEPEEPAPEEPEPEEVIEKNREPEKYEWNPEWEYASFSKIHTDGVWLYYSNAENRKDRVVAVNAGHGTPGGSSVKTQCHPDGSAKVTGGSTAGGSTMATAISTGMTFADGTPEAAATLSLAEILKTKLLDNGYDVLMLREDGDCQLDNIARTVFANAYADCHLSLHYDSTGNDKGFFYISVPEHSSYRAMEPVASHWQEHMNLGEAVLSGMKANGLKIFSGGSMAIDLTQTSYSTIPSVDLEVGDKESDHSEQAQVRAAEGILSGLNLYFQ